jgi:EAL domain-containing protein (putative c-di-GMP-specific phosphodiesterase class I)
VVAEGIETAEQLASLRKMGVDAGQGYLLARPMPAAQATSLIFLERSEPP